MSIEASDPVKPRVNESFPTLILIAWSLDGLLVGEEMDRTRKESVEVIEPRHCHIRQSTILTS